MNTNNTKRPYVRKVKVDLVVEPIVEAPIVAKRAYTKKANKLPKIDEISELYSSLQRNHKDYYDLQLRYSKIFTLLGISTAFNVAASVLLAIVGLK